MSLKPEAGSKSRRSILFLLVVAVFFGATQPTRAREKAGVIRVCVTPKKPAVTQFVEPDEPDYAKKLKDSAKDLRRLLSARRLQFVNNAADADIVVEVMGRSVRATGGTSTFIVPNGFGGFNGASYPTARTIVFVRMTVGTYAKDIVGWGRGRLWSPAAKDAAGQIDRWIDANRDRILTTRTGARP